MKNLCLYSVIFSLFTAATSEAVPFNLQCVSQAFPSGHGSVLHLKDLGSFGAQIDLTGGNPEGLPATNLSYRVTKGSDENGDSVLILNWIGGFGNEYELLPYQAIIHGLGWNTDHTISLGIIAWNGNVKTETLYPFQCKSVNE